jgi:dolichol kinase
LITTLWSAFRFVMVPIGQELAPRFPPSTYATLFVLIWGSYVAADASSEIVGSLFGKQKLRVWGLGDVNRKSLAGTWGGFLAALALCLSVVLAHGLPLSWMVLAVVIAVSSTLFELFSPRGTDDFTMATANALLCWAFACLVY